MSLEIEQVQRRPNSAFSNLRAPTDVRLAHQLFEANCGPACLAAILSVQVCDVIGLFDQFPLRPFTSRRKMEDVLHLCGLEFSRTTAFPHFGLALIQFDGPWSRISGSAKWAGRYTHWVGVSGDTIYEVNADRWLEREEWHSSIGQLLLGHYAKATGWSFKQGLEVAAQAFAPEAALPGYNFGRQLLAS